MNNIDTTRFLKQVLAYMVSGMRMIRIENDGIFFLNKELSSIVFHCLQRFWFR